MVDNAKYEIRRRGRLQVLGQKLSTLMWYGRISFKHFEGGIVIKPHLQKSIILFEDEIDWLNEELTAWRNRQKLLEEI